MNSIHNEIKEVLNNNTQNIYNVLWKKVFQINMVENIPLLYICVVLLIPFVLTSGGYEYNIFFLLLCQGNT